MHHIIPLADTIFHEPYDTCPCNPTVEGNCVFHNSGDLREFIEKATGESCGGYEILYDKNEHEVRL